MPSAKLSSLEMGYDQSGSGPDLILLHGFGASRRFWLRAIVEYLAANFRVTACDLRGHGESGRPATGYTSADVAGDVLELLDVLGIERTHVMGHSYGGRAALQLATLQPKRITRNVVVDSRLDALQPTPRLGEWPQRETWRAALERIGVAADSETRFTYEFFISWLRQLLAHRAEPDLPPILREFALWPGAEAAIQQWEALADETTAAADMERDPGLDRAAIASITQPTLGIYGASSFCLPTLSELERLLPHMKAMVIPGAGHRLPSQRPFLFRQVVRDFLTEKESARNDAARS